MEARDYVVALVEMGFKQAQITEKTGIPQPTISKVLRGDVKDVLSRNYRALQALHAEMVAAATPATPAVPEAESTHAG